MTERRGGGDRQVDFDGLQVAVVGAGIGGAAAALLLARGGAHVTLYERVAEPRAVGAGILLQPNGLAVLYGLGLRDTIASAGFVASEGAVYDETGAPLLRTDTFDFGDGLDHFLALRRSTLFDALIGTVVREDRVETRFGVEVDAVPDADLVVGADGVHSAIRAAAAIPHTLRATGVRYVRGLVSGEVVDGFGEHWTRLGLFGIGPVGDTTYVFAGTGSPEIAAAIAARDLDAFRAGWVDAFPPSRHVLERVAAFDDLLVNEVETVHCRAFVKGNVALLGDAAHAMHPNAGQGANSALVDAAQLVRYLGALTSNIDAALRVYSADRAAQVHRVQRDSARLARLSGIRSAAGRRLRNAVLRRVGRRGLSRRRLLRVMQVDPAEIQRSVRSISGEPGTPPTDPASAKPSPRR